MNNKGKQGDKFKVEGGGGIGFQESQDDLNLSDEIGSHRNSNNNENDMNFFMDDPDDNFYAGGHQN